MNFSARSIWEMTTLFVRDPAQASKRIAGIGWPINVSLLMIILAGIISGVMWAVDQSLFGAAAQEVMLPDGRSVKVAPATPMAVGIISALVGVLFSYFIYWVGSKSGGKGDITGVMAVMAALQIALTVLGVITGFLAVALPFLALGLALFVVFVSFRGYAYAVMQAHGFDTMGRAVMVMFGALFVTFFALLVVMTFLSPILMPNMISELENVL